MSEISKLQDFTKGIIKENPVFVALLGLCPALAVTSTVETAFGMGILVVFVLTLSNVIISLVRNLIPDEVRIPAFIVVIATFVTIVRMLTEALAPALFDSLGIYLPLIVVNCIILGRATSFASKNNVGRSLIDGVGMAFGFTLALFTVGFIREFFGTGAIAYGVNLPLAVSGSLFNFTTPLLNMDILVGPAGGFIVLGVLLAVFKQFDLNKQAKIKALRKKEAIERAAQKKAGGLA